MYFGCRIIGETGTNMDLSQRRSVIVVDNGGAGLRGLVAYFLVSYFLVSTLHETIRNVGDVLDNKAFVFSLKNN